MQPENHRPGWGMPAGAAMQYWPGNREDVRYQSTASRAEPNYSRAEPREFAVIPTGSQFNNFSRVDKDRSDRIETTFLRGRGN